MDFLGKTYKFKNDQSGLGFAMKTIKRDDTYVTITEFNHPDTGDRTQFETAVTISSTMYVESPAIDVKEHQQNYGLDLADLKINDRPVDKFKVKCKFKGKKLSPVSTILVLHHNMKKWVSYPFSIIGEITHD